MKTCPFCAEEIQDEATKCKHCKEFLPIAQPPPIPPSSSQRRLPWYFQTSGLLVALTSAGPLALPLVWWHPRLKWQRKLGISIATLVFTWLCVWSILWLLNYIKEQLAWVQSAGVL